ncbi:MAG: sigma-70 family RNA polymerase sigma factor, partial [Verrucomicrobia bacterium]|nr:sigma-70 family RNA polymerase sigma factor [Verrucomicrobiota bacterium]
SQAQKRGGNAAFISIDEALAEERYRLLPATVADPAQLLDHVWANTVIDRVLQQLKAHCAAAGIATLFEVLHNYITGDAVRGDYAAAATRLQMTEAAARKATHDLRAEFRRLLFREIGRTVGSPAGIEDEIRQLFALFAR